MNKEELRNRTKKFGIQVVNFLYSLPKDSIAYAITNQLVRSATSVGANYRAALRSRSEKEYIAKMGTILEEADESLYWLEVIQEIPQLNESTLVLNKLIGEANELTAIFASALKTLKSKQNLTS